LVWLPCSPQLRNDVASALLQVKNLPAPSPRAQSGSESEMEMEEFSGDAGAVSGLDAMPGNADMVFDCIRVTWVVSPCLGKNVA